MIYQGILRAWDAGTYLATVEPVGNLPAELPSIPVSRGIAAAQMVTGRYVAVARFSATNPIDAVVIAVYT